MADKLYPLVFKPGILRDGTPFQGEYCTNGQWVRWQRGNVRKIGGMQGFNKAFPTVAELPTFYLLQKDNASLWIYLVNNKQVNVYQADNNFAINNAPNVVTNITANGLAPDTTTLCQILPILTSLQPPKQLLFFVAKNYLTNINSTDAGTLYTIAPYTNNLNGMQPVVSELDNGQIIPSGGFCYSNPYLFLYGSDGVVLCSNKGGNVFNFKTSADRLSGGSTITISTDKVIYGTSIRGGDTSPTLLCWTLSSVVRVTNVGPLAEGQIDAFKPNTISQSCSIMSSRCVVEYDGLFFWPGTDRFFVYNGQVQEVSNVMNLNYFFDNVDMNKRQLVYGVPNLKYGEIWWFYPELVNAGQPTIGCTRAVIYNIRENTWYDTAIPRDSGMLLESDGSMYTFGRSLVDAVNTDKYLFKHEVGTNEVLYNNVNNAVQQPITSSFTTPIFSWASFSPLKGNDGIDRSVQLKRIEPDMKVNDPKEEQKFVLTINTQIYAQSKVYSTTILQFTGGTPKIDYMAQGRQMSFTVSSTNFFEMGHWFMLLTVGDGR